MKTLTNKGFTLIEMLIAVSLVLILSSIGIPIYNGYIKNSKIDLAKSNLGSIYLAEINHFYENQNENFQNDLIQVFCDEELSGNILKKALSSAENDYIILDGYPRE